MDLSRRRVMRDLTLLGTAAGLYGCSPAAPAQPPAAPVPPPPPKAPQEATASDPIRLSIQGLCLLHPEKSGDDITKVNVALLNPKHNGGLSLGTHYPTLSIPRALIKSYDVEPVSSDAEYMHWNLASARVTTTVVPGVAKEQVSKDQKASAPKIDWNDEERDVLACPNSQPQFRSLAYVPHMSEFGESLAADWNSPAKSAAIVSLIHGSFEPAGLPLSKSEQFDESRWIFRREDNESKFKKNGQETGRALKNVVTAALTNFSTLTFEFTGGRGGTIVINAEPHPNMRFDPMNQPLRILNMAGPHSGKELPDFLAYFDLTKNADKETTEKAKRYFPVKNMGCGETIECGCCPPSIG
jgi:hypothetical protein